MVEHSQNILEQSKRVACKMVEIRCSFFVVVVFQFETRGFLSQSSKDIRMFLHITQSQHSCQLQMLEKDEFSLKLSTRGLQCNFYVRVPF